jgi:hypothetical protein
MVIIVIFHMYQQGRRLVDDRVGTAHPRFWGKKNQLTL